METSTKIPNSYFSLVRRRFFANRVGILGLVFVFFLIFTAVFADFLSPYNPAGRDSDRVFYPPQGINFFDQDYNFSLRPFAYGFIEGFGSVDLGGPTDQKFACKSVFQRSDDQNKKEILANLCFQSSRIALRPIPE